MPNNKQSSKPNNIYFAMKSQNNPSRVFHHPRQQIRFHLLHMNFIFGRLARPLGFH